MDNHLQTFISKRIRQLRKQKNMTQEQLEEKAGLGFSYVYKLENKPTNVKIDTIEKIISALEVDLSIFFDIQRANEGDELEKLFLKIKKLPKQKQTSIISVFEQILDQID